MLEKGIKAPDFELLDKDGKEVKLSDFLGKRLFFIFIRGITLPDAPARPVPLRKIMRNSKTLMSPLSESARILPLPI